MHSEIKRFGTIVRELLSETSEDPTYARFTVFANILRGETKVDSIVSSITETEQEYCRLAV